MKKDNRYVIIMAGGIGSRFWPMSRKDKPKQFLDILGTGETLIQMTYRRFLEVCPKDNIYVVTSEEHADLVREQLEIDPSLVLSEPLRRNTAPCIAYGAFRIKAVNPEAVIAVTPADHLITKQDVFTSVINEAFQYAEGNDVLITLGIKPDRPETGYGYIQAKLNTRVQGFSDLHKVKAFTEKPELEMAKVFLESGDFFWNSGIFVWNGTSILNAFERHLPDIYMAFSAGESLYDTSAEPGFIAQAYSQCRSISVDYGIMEKADNVFVICTDPGWSDLGTWSSLYLHSKHDTNSNSVNGGQVFAFNSEGNIISLPEGKIAVIQGLDDYIIVDSGDALLVVRKDEEQNIKNYLESINRKTGEKYM